MHDYDPSWDYEIDDKNEEFLAVFSNMKNKIASELLPQLNAFDDFELAFVIFNDIDTLGVYCNGTQSRPVICIDMHNVCRESDNYGLLAIDITESTILHELGHALQEWSGLEYDCEWAEDFAYEYLRFGTVIKEDWK